ncbi:MAG: tetratricopeptide repeat protein [Acidobacteria bacterium]|nr:tetratricopeptide repeat protein [Acidobacteriota bacterium]
MKQLSVWMLVLVMMGCATRTRTVEPVKTSVPLSAEARERVAEGVRLHDQGDYPGAIRKYEEALALSPSNHLIFYEMSYAYFKMGEYQKSLDAARQAATYQSDMLPAIYMQIGSCLDGLARPQEAVAAYEEGLRLASDDHLLHYNLAVTYRGLKQKEQAMAHLKKAMLSRPTHPSSHLALATLYAEDGYRIPALLAYCRFLLLEPDSPRSGQAAMAVQQLISAGVSKQNSGEISIFVSTDEPKYDGDFIALSTTLSLASALRYASDKEPKQPIEYIVGELETMFSIMGSISEKENKEGFAWQYYAPFFIELEKKNFVEPFVYHIFRLADDPGIQAWLEEHPSEIDQMVKWAVAYEFQTE